VTATSVALLGRDAPAVSVAEAIARMEAIAAALPASVRRLVARAVRFAGASGPRPLDRVIEG
jgi:hypothetical protein